MLNQRLLGILAVIAMLLPANFQSILSEDQGINQENSDDKDLTPNEKLFEYLMLKLPGNDVLTKENLTEQTEEQVDNSSEETTQPKQVTTSVSKQAADNTENEQTPEEELIEVIEEWEQNLPFVEDDSPQAQFINTILPAAILIANEQNIYPSVMIAQAALESSWGRSDLAQAHNNLMGTKGSWNGKSVTARTREDVGGESVYIDAGFSVYDSWADSLNRYGQLMKNGTKSNPTIYEGTWRENTSNYTDATAWLQGRYATDTAYADKLNRTIQSFHLDQYDDIEAPEKNLEKVLTQLTIENQTDL